MDYSAPTGSTDLNAPYVGKNVSAGIQGSKVPPHAVEYPQREIVQAIVDSGQVPSNGDLGQLSRALRKNMPYGIAAGTANAITVPLDPVQTDWAKLRLFMVLIVANNTGAVTIAPNGLTPRNLIKNDGVTALSAGDLVARGVALCLNDGSNVQLLGMVGGSAGGGIPDNEIWHLGTATLAGANTWTTTLSPALQTGATNYFSAIQFSTTNTGAATVNGTPIVIDSTGAALTGGEIPTSGRARFFFDGTSHRLTNPASTSPGVTPFRVVAWGRVNSAGPTIQQGSGFTVTKNAAGDVTVTFTNTPPTGFLAILSFYPLNRYGGGSPGANGWPSGDYTQSGTIVEYGRTTNTLSLQLGISGATALYDGIFSFLILSI